MSALGKEAVQLFEHSHARFFTSKPIQTAALNISQFALVPPISILTLLNTKPATIQTGLEVSEADLGIYRSLDKGTALIEMALKVFRKRTPLEKVEGAGVEA